jgi:hypothetical protein
LELTSVKVFARGVQLTKTVSQGIEMANQVLDKEIEIEIDVDKMVNATKNIANQTVQHSMNIYEKSSELSKTVAQDVTDLTGALVEDSVETYSVLSEATRSTIEQSSSLFCLNGVVSTCHA